jgi:hypothetical protein
MSTYRRVHRLHKEIAAYVAGLIDGEGTITLCREHRGARRCIVVSISNPGRPVSEDLSRHARQDGIGTVRGRNAAKRKIFRARSSDEGSL